MKPGCTAADETLVVKGHLDGLAKGLGGFGVLRTSKKRLELAAQAARVAGAVDVGAEIQGIANRLDGVRTPEQAASMADELDPLVQKTWDLGKRCGSLADKARELAEKVVKGEMRRDDAVSSLKEFGKKR